MKARCNLWWNIFNYDHFYAQILVDPYTCMGIYLFSNQTLARTHTHICFREHHSSYESCAFLQFREHLQPRHSPHTIHPTQHTQHPHKPSWHHLSSYSSIEPIPHRVFLPLHLPACLVCLFSLARLSYLTHDPKTLHFALTSYI